MHMLAMPRSPLQFSHRGVPEDGSSHEARPQPRAHENSRSWRMRAKSLSKISCDRSN
jgi:hypothetical protein